MAEDRPYRAFWILLAIWLALLVFFRLFPSIDTGFSGVFYSASTCKSDNGTAVCGLFPMGEVPFFVALRTFLYYLPPVLAVVLAISLVVPGLDRRLNWPEMSRRNRMVAIGAWIVNAGLLVNLLLKAHSGRPRPADTTLFGGHLPFVPAGDLSGACTSNCSFISGEAASAGWLFCLLALVPPQARRWLFWPVLLVSALTALLRVFFGRHFFSDALLGWLSAVVVFELAAAVFGWNESDGPDAAAGKGRG